jgi:hypothetical protein
MAWTWTLGVNKDKVNSVILKATLTSDANASGTLSFADKLTADQLTQIAGIMPLSCVMVPGAAPNAPTGTFDVVVYDSLDLSLGAKTGNSASVSSFIDLTQNITDITNYLKFSCTTLGNTKTATFYFKCLKTNQQRA